MNKLLNFNLVLPAAILAFVSFLNIPLAYSRTSERGLAASSEQDPGTSNSTGNSTTTTTLNDPEIEKLKTQIRANPQNIQKIVELAKHFYNKGDFEKTTLLLWKQIDKLDRAGILLLARAHESRSEPTEMIRALNIQIGKNEKDVEAITLLGNAFRMQKKNKDALENYKKAIEINPKFEEAYLGIQKMYEQRNPPNLYELRILFQDMIDNIGPKSQYFQKLCEVNAKDDNTVETAIEACRQATQKDPKAADSFVYLGNSLKLSGKSDEAAATLKKAAHDFPKSEFAQFTYGKLLEDQKNPMEAMKYYKTGTEADPKAARSWMGLASTSFDLKKYEIALIAYKNACKYDSKNAVAFRRATTTLRNNKVSDWIGKFESGSESCSW